MQKIISFFSHPAIKKLDKEFTKIFENAPHLPKKATDILVKIIPYLVLISGLLLISGGLRSIFGFGSLHNALSFLVNVPSIYFYVIGFLQVITGIVSIAAYQPLKDRKIEGWFVLLGLNILELLMNIVSVIFLSDGIFGLLLGLLIGLYFLYEIKSSYAQSGTALLGKKAKAIVKKVKSTKK